ncbi:MAG: peptidase S9 [Gemmatimonadales bacterium]|nr:MAG: peptidase S9 [Gemmatimonadales bacterium]
MQPMKHLIRLLAALAAALFVCPVPADAQYFGRNKVQYDRFDFRVMTTPHFELHFYPEATLPAEDAARMAERWYERLARTFEHELVERRPLIFYANHPDFQQTNVLRGTVGEGTGGVTEGLRDRVVMPLGSSYAATDHVLGHELVHSFQFDIARGRQGGGGISGLMRLPLWFVEGMAEYYSLGPRSTLTGMWLRDALLRDDLPTLRQLTREQQRFFPYRYGHAFFAFVGGTYGDMVIPGMLRTAVREGYEASVVGALGMSGDTLSARWHEAISAHYAPLMEGRTSPAEAGSLLISPETGAGRQNVAPSLSPDGRYVAFLSERDLFTTEVFLADAATGRIIRGLTRSIRDAHADAIRFIDSAGGWSPDGERIAVSVFAQGRNRIQVYRASDGRIVERLDVPPHIGEIRSPAWSPDGNRIAFSGQAGGITNLFELEVATGEVTQLTHGRNAALQPTYAPDGATLAFVTDLGPATDFQQLVFGPMRIALLDRESGEVEPLDLFPGAEHWNPQFTPDGSTLFFLADPDGFRDIFRVELADRQILRVTRVATAVSGITDATPALSVARTAGTVAFSVFDGGEFHIHSLDAVDVGGEAVDPDGVVALAGRLLPGGSDDPTDWINRMLADADAGLPPVDAHTAREAEPVDRSLGLDFIGQAAIGVGASQFGTQVGGAISAVFSDILGNRSLYTAVQAQGEVRDIGGQVFYQDQERRLNWGVGAAHSPVRYFRTALGEGPDNTQALVRDDLRQTQSEVVSMVAYPLSTIRRLEFNAGYTRYGFDAQRDIFLYDQAGNFLRREQETLPAPDAVNLGRASVAFVEDNSFFGFNAPVRGWRGRYEVAYLGGSVDFLQATLDHRRYVGTPVPEITFAVRGMHIGRYGSDMDNASSVFRPMFLGFEPLMRGYSSQSFRVEECTFTPAGQCAEFERLLGHRIGVANVEARIALLGTDRFGLLSFPLLPTDLILFGDAGVAWSRGESPELRWDPDTTDRVPVASVGVATRTNVLGALVLEIFYAHPFQRPERGGHFGVSFAPGW